MQRPYLHPPAVCDLPGSDGGQDDFVEAATSLFQDVAVSVEENESFLRTSFGPEALLAVVTSLHGEVGAATPLTLSSIRAVKLPVSDVRHLACLRGICACSRSAMQQAPRYCSGTPVSVSWRGYCRASTRTRAALCFQRPRRPAPVRSAMQSLRHCCPSAVWPGLVSHAHA